MESQIFATAKKQDRFPVTNNDRLISHDISFLQQRFEMKEAKNFFCLQWNKWYNNREWKHRNAVFWKREDKYEKNPHNLPYYQHFSSNLFVAWSIDFL